MSYTSEDVFKVVSVGNVFHDRGHDLVPLIEGSCDSYIRRSVVKTWELSREYAQCHAVVIRVLRGMSLQDLVLTI